MRLLKLGWLAGLGLLLLLSSGANAQEETKHVNGVRVVVNSPWPDSLSKGYLPMFLDFENTNLVPAGVLIRATGGFRDQVRVQKTVALAPGERRRMELLLPAYVNGAADYHVKFESGSDSDSASNQGNSSSGQVGAHAIALFSQQPAGNGRDAGWSTTLSPASASSSTPIYYGSSRGEPWRNLGLTKQADWERTASVNLVEVSYDNMSVNWESYSSLDLVLLDVSSGLPGGPELKALMEWSRLGGVVMFSGRDVNQVLAGVNDVRDWLEDRFLVHESGSGANSVRAYQCGFGRVLVHSDSGLLDAPEAMEAVMVSLRSEVRTDWTPSPRGSRGSGSGLSPEITGVGVLPYRTFVTLMVLFAICVGPLNFWYMRKKGTPARLIVSIPAVAMFASILILAYGFLGQGISVRTDSHTVTLLDQRTGLVSTADSRAVFAGIAPGRGLVPGQGTGIFPMGVDLVNRESAIYNIDHGSATAYTAGFLPSRVQVRQAVLTSRTSHLRLDFDSSSGGLLVRNALGVAVHELQVHGEDGTWYELGDAELDVGGEARLSPLDGAPIPGKPVWFERDEERLWQFHPTDLATLPTGTFSAKLEQDPFTDDCGVATREISGSHGLLGVMGGSR
ncbi:MAG: hypothetical protein ACI9D0_000868 [Bacteroidia bacterium]